MVKEKASPDKRFMAALPYALSLVWKLAAGAYLAFNLASFLNLKAEAAFFFYLRSEYNWPDILLCFLPITLLLFVKNDNFIKYYAKQYLILNLYIPLLFILTSIIILTILPITYLFVGLLIVSSFYNLLVFLLQLATIRAIKEGRYTEFKYLKRYLKKDKH